MVEQMIFVVSWRSGVRRGEESKGGTFLKLSLTLNRNNSVRAGVG